MLKLTIAMYRKREDAYPVSAKTVRTYIDKGILKGERILVGSRYTYFVHIEPKSIDSLPMIMAQG